MAKLNLNSVPPELPKIEEEDVTVDSTACWILSWVRSASLLLLLFPADAVGSAKLNRKSLPDVSRADFLTKLDFLFVSAAGVNFICLEAEM